MPFPDKHSQSVGRALDAVGAAVEDVGVSHGGAHVGVAEELLNRADVVAGLEEGGLRRADVGRKCDGAATRPARADFVFALAVEAPMRLRQGNPGRRALPNQARENR